MLVGAGWAWTEIGKTLNSLGFGSGGSDLNLDFSNFNFSAVDNKVEQARKELEDSIAAAQGADPMARYKVVPLWVWQILVQLETLMVLLLIPEQTLLHLRHLLHKSQ